MLRIIRQWWCLKEAAWHRATAALPGGEYSLVFEATYNVQWSTDNLALDNIEVNDGPCNFSSCPPSLTAFGIFIVPSVMLNL